MGRHGQKAGKAKAGRKNTWGQHSSVRRNARTPSVNPLAYPSLYVVVFCGGFCGTALRYWMSTSLNPLPQIIGIHWGTFAANMAATFFYALLSAVLVGVSSVKAKELTSRGLGMGFCGGLSTMSTLALEIVGSQLGWLYAIISVFAGIVLAAFGAYIGSLIASPYIKKVTAFRESQASPALDSSRRSGRHKHKHSGR